MSDELKTIKQTLFRDVVVGKKCDVCGKDIPPTSRSFPRTTVPFFEVTMHHNDWGEDSGDSYEHLHACSPACAIKLAEEYLRKDFEGTNSKAIDIEHIPAWFMPKEASGDGV